MPSRIRCSKCRRYFDGEPTEGHKWCTECRAIVGVKGAIHANAVPDYAEMATVVVEMVYGRPRKQFAAQHHRAANVILKRWAEGRKAT